MHCFTFGKYVGLPLDEVPASYLGLALETFTLPDALHVAIRLELAHRFGLIDAKPPVTPKHTKSGALTEGVIRSIYHRLSLKYHPDRGGSTDAMQAVNDFHDSLKQVFQ